MIITAQNYIDAHRYSSDLPYHNWSHPFDVMRRAKLLVDWFELHSEMKTRDMNTEVLYAACLFHDVGYKPLAKDNEERAAAIAETSFDIEGHSSVEEIEMLKSLIMATKNHVPLVSSYEACILCDADLWGFCSDYESFQTNNALIRDEFIIHGNVSEAAYREGRKTFLEDFLDRARNGQLFHVPFNLKQRHDKAIKNITKALEEE